MKSYPRLNLHNRVHGKSRFTHDAALPPLVCRCLPGALPLLHGDSGHASLLHGAGSGTVQQRRGCGGLEDLSHIQRSDHSPPSVPPRPPVLGPFFLSVRPSVPPSPPPAHTLSDDPLRWKANENWPFRFPSSGIHKSNDTFSHHTADAESLGENIITPLLGCRQGETHITCKGENCSPICCSKW